MFFEIIFHNLTVFTVIFDQINAALVCVCVLCVCVCVCVCESIYQPVVRL